MLIIVSVTIISFFSLACLGHDHWPEWLDPNNQSDSGGYLQHEWFTENEVSRNTTYGTWSGWTTWSDKSFLWQRQDRSRSRWNKIDIIYCVIHNGLYLRKISDSLFGRATWEHCFVTAVHPPVKTKTEWDLEPDSETSWFDPPSSLPPQGIYIDPNPMNIRARFFIFTSWVMYMPNVLSYTWKIDGMIIPDDTWHLLAKYGVGTHNVTLDVIYIDGSTGSWTFQFTVVSDISVSMPGGTSRTTYRGCGALLDFDINNISNGNITPSINIQQISGPGQWAPVDGTSNFAAIPSQATHRYKAIVFAPENVMPGSTATFLMSATTSTGQIQSLTFSITAQNSVDDREDLIGGPPPVKSKGYWKKHPDQWPVASVEIGGVSYTTEQAIEILKNAKSKDCTSMLSAQLVAAKLNGFMSAEDYYLVEDTVNNSDTYLETFPIGSNPSGNDREIGIGYKDILDKYNNGELWWVGIQMEENSSSSMSSQSKESGRGSFGCHGGTRKGDHVSFLVLMIFIGVLYSARSVFPVVKSIILICKR